MVVLAKIVLVVVSLALGVLLGRHLENKRGKL